MKTLLVLLAAGLITTTYSFADTASEANAQASGVTATNPDEEPVPDIRIVKRGTTRMQEYRMNGKLYMVKVIPAKGKPYYLVDPTGDGIMQRRGGLVEPIAVPQWVIMRF